MAYKFSNYNLMIYKLSLAHIVIIALSNALVHIPVDVFGIKLTWAAFTYPFIVVITDLTVRALGKDIAAKTIYRAFPIAVLVSILVVNLEGKGLDFALIIGLASACAYGIGTLIDVHIFQKIREHYNAWWIAPMLSTVIANVIDTYTFFIIAFKGSEDVYMATHWVEMATSLVIYKIVIGIILFLPLYGYVLRRFNLINIKCK
jgi:hypothetical protein|tara:strand:+ start:559 stop:1167 length:609 start_codon:yes stop_codon:yes gene_type:complete